jgi:hypothetical protein
MFMLCAASRQRHCVQLIINNQPHFLNVVIRQVILLAYRRDHKIDEFAPVLLIKGWLHGRHVI